MQIYEFIVEPDREDHIARHGVTLDEVEDIVFGRPFVRRVQAERFRLIGQTEAGRYLTVFVGSRGRGVYGLITARDATEAERRLFQEHRRR